MGGEDYVDGLVGEVAVNALSNDRVCCGGGKAAFAPSDINMRLSPIRGVVITRLMFAVALLLTFFCFQGRIAIAIALTTPQVTSTIISYPVSGMPVTLTSVVGEVGEVRSKLVYSITNSSEEKVVEIYVRVFIVDLGGKVITAEEGSSNDKVDPAATVQGVMLLRESVKQNALSIAAVFKVVTDRGVWEVDRSELDRAVLARIRKKPETKVSVHFDAHVRLTAEARPEIFKLALMDIIADQQKAERLGAGSSIMVLRESVDFELPQIPDVNLQSVDLEEIRKAAGDNGRVRYLIYRPLEVEGSRVLARISIQDQVGRRYPAIWVQYKFTFLFICLKKDGRWTIEKSLGYAQG